MAKEIILDAAGRERMKVGIDKAANAIKGTMGAAGRNVSIWKQFGAPQNTNDGYTIAKSITLLDSTENMGAEMVKEVADKTVKMAGDGTSCASLLFQSIVSEGMDTIKTGVNVMNVKRGIEKAVVMAVSKLKGLSTPVTKEKLIDIASISANNDNEIGIKIAEAINEVGKDGIIYVEESKTYETTVEVVDGMQIDSGFISPFFINSERKPECVLEDVYIVITDKKISKFEEILPLIEIAVTKEKSLLIIADDVSGAALEGLIINKGRGLKVCAIKSTAQKEMMDDIAILTRGTYLSTQTNIKLSGAGIDKFGKAKKVVINNNTTTIIDGEGLNADIEKRIETIKGNIAESISDHDTKSLTERHAKLSGGVAILKVGGATESEISEKKDRIDDAVCATKAAMEEGYVAGGGVSYIACMPSVKTMEVENEEERIGTNIIFVALQDPFLQILKNAGINSDDYLKKVKFGDFGFGVNVKTGKFENLLESGVIDPTKVLRVALENAASAAALFLITECVLSEIQTF